jgi:hypothetical protein
MPPVSDRVYRVQAPYEGNAVHLYLVRRGPDVVGTLQASRDASAAIERATAHALRQLTAEA